MRLIRDKYEKRLDFGDDTVELTGMVIGDVNVRSGGLLELRGMVDGSVTVHVGGGVQLRGTVMRNVRNVGGALNIFGVVKGTVLHQSGTTTYYKGTIVNGAVVPADCTVGAEIIDR